MSGHSKWSSIKHQKGAADKKRGVLFSKLARAIIVAAKEGGGDPANNLSLQNAVTKARAASMPRENIERAIARGAGAGEGGESYEAVSYEGYGSGGAALIVEGLTDNRNRTAADVRFLFGKYGGSLGAPGSVAWMFERKGLVAVPSEGVDLDELTLVAADGGAEDVRDNGDGGYEVISDPADLAAVRQALEEAGIAFSSADLTMEAQTTIEVDVDQARSLLRLVEALEEHDDVQDVYFNFDIPDAVLEEAVYADRYAASRVLVRQFGLPGSLGVARRRRRSAARRSTGCAGRPRRRSRTGGRSAGPRAWRRSRPRPPGSARRRRRASRSRRARGTPPPPRGASGSAPSAGRGGRRRGSRRSAASQPCGRSGSCSRTTRRRARPRSRPSGTPRLRPARSGGRRSRASPAARPRMPSAWPVRYSPVGRIRRAIQRVGAEVVVDLGAGLEPLRRPHRRSGTGRRRRARGSARRRR